MERGAAIRKLMKVLGPKAYWRINKGISSPERRHTQQLSYLDAQWQAAMYARDRDLIRERLLNVPEYLEVKAAYVAATQRKESVGCQPYYRFEVGTADNLGVFNALHPKASGDTWEEVFAQLAAKEER
jgi:hypothetical protein